MLWRFKKWFTLWRCKRYGHAWREVAEATVEYIDREGMPIQDTGIYLCARCREMRFLHGDPRLNSKN